MKSGGMKNIETLIHNPFDCLILANLQIQVLDKVRERILPLDFPEINVSESLSAQLISIPVMERGKAAQDWLMNVSVENANVPLLLTNVDLLFHPSLCIDSFELIRKFSRLQRSVFLWPGDYHENVLSYAIPAHHHFRIWKIAESLLINPKVLIYQLDSEEGV